MQLPVPIQIGLPLSLFAIMLGLGMTLAVADFLRLVTRPRAVAVGLTAQLFGMPLLAAGVVAVLAPAPELAMGLMVLAFCPSGTTSNLFSYLARGDVALSVTLTALASVITPFSVPVLTDLALDQLGGSARAVDFPVVQTMGRLAAVTLAPLAVGMTLASRAPVLTAKAQPWVHRCSVAGFALVIIGILASVGERLPGFLAETGVLCAALMLAAIALGLGVSRAAGLPPAQRRTVAIEVGMQHGGMALVVTQGVLASSVMSVVPVLYGLMMLVPVLLMVVFVRTRAAAPVTVPG